MVFVPKGLTIIGQEKGKNSDRGKSTPTPKGVKKRSFLASRAEREPSGPSRPEGKVHFLSPSSEKRLPWFITCTRRCSKRRRTVRSNSGVPDERLRILVSRKREEHTIFSAEGKGGDPRSRPEIAGKSGWVTVNATASVLPCQGKKNAPSACSEK